MAAGYQYVLILLLLCIPVTQPNLEGFLASWQRKMVRIGGDGNCLFRAISYNLFGHEDAHFSLRSIIERFETCNSSIFEKRMTMVNESTFTEHLKQLYRPNTWATHIEVFAIATYFQAPVYFCADPPHPKRGVYCWERYMPVASVENLS